MKLLISFLAGAVVAGLIFFLGFYKTEINSHVDVSEDNKVSSAKEDCTSLAGISDILIDPVEARTYIHNYVKAHFPDESKKFSRSIFFGRCAIEFMGDYFKNARPEIVGVRIFNIQYNKLMPNSQRMGQREGQENQQSLLFVPEDSEKKILWNEWNKTLSKYDSLKAKKPLYFNVINHGELCPNNCPDDPVDGKK